MLKGGILSTNEKQKLKMKKNATEYVDMLTEKKLDPKYKTEMCKSWSDTGFCVYGNKCRFAHGKNELFNKPVGCCKYKQQKCKSFKELGFCMYGTRCNFKHDERKLHEIERSYYTHLLGYYSFCEDCRHTNRLRIFRKLNEAGPENSCNSSGNTSAGSRSPVNIKLNQNSFCSDISGVNTSDWNQCKSYSAQKPFSKHLYNYYPHFQPRPFET